MYIQINPTQTVLHLLYSTFRLGCANASASANANANLHSLHV